MSDEDERIDRIAEKIQGKDKISYATARAIARAIAINSSGS